MTDCAPDAYCFFQEIDPRPPFVATFDRNYLLHAVRRALHVEVGGKRWVLPSSFADWVHEETEIKVSLDRPVTSGSILSITGFSTGFPDRPVGFQMSRVTREMAQHCRAWGKGYGHPPEARVFFQALLSTCATLIERSMQRKFAEELGESWTKTLTRIRMIRAIELLSDADRPAIQVASECGYASVSAFNQGFKDFTGQTPTEYRRGIA